MRRAATLVVWFGLLLGLWTVFTGTALTLEVLFGVGAAALGALLAELLRSRGLFAFRLDPGLLVQCWKLVWQAPFDQVLAAWVLLRSVARGRRVRGEWVRVPFPSGDDEQGAWRRAFVAVLGTATPNAIVVDFEGGEVLLHSLEPRVSTGREAL